MFARMALVAVVVVMGMGAQESRAAADPAKVNKFASEVTAAAVAVKAQVAKGNPQFQVFKTINFLAERIRKEAAVIVINAGRADQANTAAALLVRANQIRTDVKNLENAVRNLKGQAQAANDKATEDLAKKIEDLVENIDDSSKDLVRELD